jgi:hypothetical protein
MQRISEVMHFAESLNAFDVLASTSPFHRHCETPKAERSPDRLSALNVENASSV